MGENEGPRERHASGGGRDDGEGEGGAPAGEQQEDPNVVTSQCWACHTVLKVPQVRRPDRIW